MRKEIIFPEQNPSFEIIHKIGVLKKYFSSFLR